MTQIKVKIGVVPTWCDLPGLAKKQGKENDYEVVKCDGCGCDCWAGHRTRALKSQAPEMHEFICPACWIARYGAAEPNYVNLEEEEKRASN